MAVSMVGELNPYELFNMALLAPESELMAVLQGKSDRYPQDIAFSALKKRRQMKTAVQGVEAQNELSGVAALPADNMMQMAEGGIVAFDQGGTIHGQAGLFVRPDLIVTPSGVSMTAEQLAEYQRGFNPNRLLPTAPARTAVGPFDPTARVVSAAPAAPAAVAPQAEAGAGLFSRAGSLFGRLVGGLGSRVGLGAAGLGLYSPELASGTMQPELTKEERASRAATFIPEANKRLAELEKRITPTTPPDQVKAIQAEQQKISDAIQEARQFLPKSREGVPILPTNAASPAQLYDVTGRESGLGSLVTKGDATARKPSIAAKTSVAAAAAAPEMRPAAAAAAPAAPQSATDLVTNLLGQRAPAAPATGGDDQSVFDRFYSLATGMTKAEQDKLDALLSAREAKITSGKEERKGEARGLAALQAASELLQSGRVGAASRGAAFGVSAKQAEKYLDNEQKIQDRLDETGIAAANARLANKQGNVKLAAEMMGQAQTRALKAAELAYDNEYKRVDAMLKASVADENKRHNMAAEAAERAKTSVMSQAYGAQADLYSAQAGYYRMLADNPKGEITPAIRMQMTERVMKDVDDAFNKMPLVDRMKITDPNWKDREFNKRVEAMGLPELKRPVPEGRQVTAPPAAVLQAQ